MLKAVLIVLASASTTTASALAADWSQADVDKAVSRVAQREIDNGSAKMFQEAGTFIKHIATQKDLNGDGVNEIEIVSEPNEIKNGSGFIWGPVGSEISLLIADGKGGWTGTFGMDASQIAYHQRAKGLMPDIELIGDGDIVQRRNDCYPIYRFRNGDYGFWKVCDMNGQPHYADVADWFEPGDESVVPRDFDDAPAVIDQGLIPESEFRPPEFDHNGSMVLVDHRHGLITYGRPKKSIAGTIKAGDVLFKADGPWDQYDANRGIHGTAYVFKKGCEPAPYKVTGGFDGIWQVIILKGLAPVRDKKSCAILGYRKTANSVLKFESYMD